MAKAPLTQRYHFNTVCAGILRIIYKPAEFSKLYPFLDEEYFFREDPSEQSAVLRETIKIAKMVYLENGANVNSVKMPVVLDRFLSANIDTDKGKMLRGQVQNWLMNAEIKARMEGDETFDALVSYIKAIQFAKHSQDLYKNYQEGKIPEAVKAMETILSKVNKIGESLSDAIDLSPDGVWKFLEDSAGKNAIPTDKLFLGNNSEIDKALGGFEKQTLNVIIAPTGGGKSMFCHHLLRRAIAQNMKVHLFCVEDRYKSFIYKYLSAQTGIEMKRLKLMDFKSDLEKAEVKRAISHLNKLVKVQFIYGHSVDTIHQLTLEYDTECRSKGQEPPMIHIIDYTGHISGLSKGDKTHEKIRAAYAARKDFALKHNKICFDFAQINREGNKRAREENIITHADLAGAYDLSQVCDNIISINRSPQDIATQTAILHVCKARDGEIGKFKVKTDFARARFDLEIDEAMEDNRLTTAQPANVTTLRSSVTPMI